MSFRTINPLYFLYGLGLDLYELSVVEDMYPVPVYMGVIEAIAKQKGWPLMSVLHDETQLYQSYLLPGPDYLFLKWNKTSGDTEITRSSRTGESFLYTQRNGVYIKKGHRLLMAETILTEQQFITEIVSKLTS